MLQYWAPQVAHFQNDSSILLFVAMALWEKQLWGTEKRKKGKGISLGWTQVTPPQWRQDAMLAFLLLPGRCRDTLLKGRKYPFWELSIQMGEHLPTWWGLIAEVLSFVQGFMIGRKWSITQTKFCCQHKSKAPQKRAQGTFSIREAASALCSSTAGTARLKHLSPLAVSTQITPKGTYSGKHWTSLYTSA